MEKQRYLKVTVLIKDNGSLKYLFVKPKRAKVISALKNMWQPNDNIILYADEVWLGVARDENDKVIDFELIKD